MADVLKQVTQSSDFVEKRKTARLDIPLNVQYRIKGEKKEAKPQKAAMTKDVSAGGCLLLTTEELSINSELELDIILGETEEEMLKLKGRIVRLNRAENKLHEYGIAFNELSKEARRLFADFCFAKMYEMIGLNEWPTDKKQRKANSI